MADETWRIDAACRKETPDLFYAYGDVAEAAAKMVCRTCPVERECLSYALANREVEGVWGGMTEDERRRLLRRERDHRLVVGLR